MLFAIFRINIDISVSRGAETIDAFNFNFESGTTKYQTGRVHAGGDYWLSAVGPSDRFGRIAAAAKGHCELAAKLQVAGIVIERDSISRIEKGTRFVADYELMVLCKVLNVPLDYLLGNN
jgi:hypothetical protein